MRSRRTAHGPGEAIAPQRDDLIATGLAAGLDACGVCDASVLTRARVELHRRRDAGLHNGMKFTYKNPDRSTEPTRTVEGAQSIIVGARRYQLDHTAPADAQHASGSVARYAWTDHYEPLKQSLDAIKTQLRAAGFRAVVFADDNAIVDREVAHRAGLGWFGKNANLLLPEAGSWFVLGCVVTTALIEPSAGPIADGCGTCRRCFDGCPTDAIVAPGVIDANRCLAWLLQKPGSFPDHFREAVGDRIYGCDDCQTVCPPNHRFGKPRTPSDAALVARVGLVELLGLDDDEIIARHGRWYIHDRDPRWVRRNALIALGNTATFDEVGVADVLARYCGGPDELLAEHAVWAAERITSRTRS